MAIAGTAVWEVRPTVGSDLNGGFFDPSVSSPGTDYSQQNAAEYSFTDLASVSADVVSSASHSFVAADVGNGMNISAGSGFTAGWYEIVSVSGGNATLDRSPGSSGTGGTYAVGGALATTLASSSPSGLPFVGGNTIWVKATGLLVVTAVMNLQANVIGTNVSFIGYNSTRGDGGQATWTTATDSINLFDVGFNNTTALTLANFVFSNTAGSPGDFMFGSGSTSSLFTIQNCKITGFVNGINANNDTSNVIVGLHLINCEVTDCSGNGVWVGDETLVLACYIHACGVGMVVESNITCTIAIIRSAIANNTGRGLVVQDAQSKVFVLENSDFYNNGGDGWYIENTGGGGFMASLWNNIFYGNAGYGINAQTFSGQQPVVYANTNAFGGNASGARNGFPFGSATDIVLSVDPFTNGAAGNFTLNSTTGGGASCKAIGFPATLP